MGHFEGFLESAETCLTPCPECSEGQFWGHKGWGPLDKSQEMPIICFAQDKKNKHGGQLLRVKLCREGGLQTYKKSHATIIFKVVGLLFDFF